MKKFAPILALAFVAAASHPPTVRANDGVGHMHSLVKRLGSELDSATSAESYALLREMWRAWDTADPAQVEAALAAIAEDDKKTPSVRAYAGLLHAYARRMRGDLTGAKKRVRELGFVSDWLVVGPFDNENKSGLPQRYMPEQELNEPVVLDRSFQGKERAVSWRLSPQVHPYGFADLGTMVRPQRDVCVYATSYVKGKPRPITAWVGVTGAFKLFWNDREVLSDSAYRQLDNDRHAVAVELGEGFNRITIKVCADESQPAVSLRLAEADGSPAKGLQIAASTQASTEAAARMRTAAKGNGTPPPSRGAAAKKNKQAQGPVAFFEAKLKAEPDNPRWSHSYARYLALTGGDPEGEHLARDLAARAAAKSPTVERLLVAAELTNDRNDRRRLIDQAKGLARKPQERVALLLAEAQLLRVGPTWREAFPMYDDVLRLDPSNVDAVLGKADLYVEAGLARTALTTLQRASEAQPQCVALLRALAGQLRALGRDVEAAETEARYAALRFDDNGYLSGQLELAVARRDKQGSTRWSQRLLASDPSSVWAHGVVARAQLALGDTDAALTRYRAGLAIAPDDVGMLRAVADLHGIRGERKKQVAALKQILRVVPQAKPVRAYLEHLEPATARFDEKYAWTAEQLLEKRVVSDDRHPQRTLRNLQVTTVFANGLSSHFHQVAFQPLTDEAAARARQYAFVFHADRQVVQLRGARVFRRDGRVDEAIESGTAPANDPTLNMYTLQRLYYVQFPRLEPGDVVELRYRVDDVAVRNEMADYFGEIVRMQSDEPVASGEYVLIAPKAKKLHISHERIPGLTREDSEKDGNKVYRFRAADLAAVEPEPGMPSYGELLGRIHVSTFPDWKSVGRYYWTLAREKLDADDDVRKLAHRLVDGLTSERDKVAAIYHYAASETRYVALELGIEGIRPRSAALTLARGWGDCKDKATLIVSMLREVGIEAEIVIVRTQQRGDFDSKTASLAPFDHAIAYIPSLDLYLDGTAEITGTGELPSMDRAAVALRITNGEGKLVRLPQPVADKSPESQEYTLEFAGKDKLRFRGTISVQGVGAPAWRSRYQANDTRRERVASDLLNAFGSLTLTTGKRGLSVANLDEVEKPLKLNVAGTTAAEREGGATVVRMGPRWRLVSAYATRATRKHELVVGALRERRQTWTLVLPKGKRLLSSPKTTKLNGPFGDFEVSLKREGAKVIVSNLLRFKKARIAPSEYAAWRDFCRAVDAASGPTLRIGD